MRLLLDTHVWLWAAIEPERLPERTRALLVDADTGVLVSVASVWEAAIKENLGKLKLPDTVERLFELSRTEGQIRALPIDALHAVAAAQLPMVHRDPFDRMLVAQARLEGLTLVTADSAVREYGGEIEWVGP